MPVQQCWRWTCPITGEAVVTDTPDAPGGWAVLNSEHVSPEGQVVAATRVLRAAQSQSQLSSDEALSAAPPEELAAVSASVAASVAVEATPLQTA